MNIWRWLKPKVCLHHWSADLDDGADGHSMNECVAYLYCFNAKCEKCGKQEWLKKANIPWEIGWTILDGSIMQPNGRFRLTYFMKPYPLTRE